MGSESPDLGPVTLVITHSATPIKRGPDARDTKVVKGRSKFRAGLAMESEGVTPANVERCTLRRVTSTFQDSTCTLHLKERPKNPATRIRCWLGINMSGPERRKPAYVSFIVQTQDENTAFKKRKSAGTAYRG